MLVSFTAIACRLLLAHSGVDNVIMLQRQVHDGEVQALCDSPCYELYNWFFRMRFCRMAKHVHRTKLSLHLLLLLLPYYYMQVLH